MSTSPGFRRARRREFLDLLRLCGFETRSLRTLSMRNLPVCGSSREAGEIGPVKSQKPQTRGRVSTSRGQFQYECKSPITIVRMPPVAFLSQGFFPIYFPRGNAQVQDCLVQLLQRPCEHW